MTVTFLSFLYGIGFMLLPGPLSGIYYVELTDAGRYIAQMYGTALFDFGLVNWLAREFDGGKVQLYLLLALWFGYMRFMRQ